MTIEHDATARRFLLRHPDGTGALTYSDFAPGVLDFEHVEVAPALRGRGLAAQLVEAACRHARQTGAGVIPSCPYVAWWFRQHPEQQDLLAPIGRGS